MLIPVSYLYESGTKKNRRLKLGGSQVRKPFSYPGTRIIHIKKSTTNYFYRALPLSAGSNALLIPNTFTNRKQNGSVQYRALGFTAAYYAVLYHCIASIVRALQVAIVVPVCLVYFILHSAQRNKQKEMQRRKHRGLYESYYMWESALRREGKLQGTWTLIWNCGNILLTAFVRSISFR